MCFLILCTLLNANNLKLVFRYDDFLLKNDSIDESVIRIFQKHKIPLVIGVIPYDSIENKIFQENFSSLPILKKGVKNNSIEIAQHGFNHQKIVNGEFNGVNQSEQKRRILKGKEMLDSIFQTNITTFIPPWNTYDKNTLKVMNEIGLKNLSSALCIGQVWSDSQISYFPTTVEDFITLNSVLEYNKNRNCVVVVMFHHYTFGNSYSLSQMDTLLSKLKTLEYIDFVTFNQLNIYNVISDTKRMESNLESNFLSKFLHLSGAIQTYNFAFLIRILNILFYLFISTLFYFTTLNLFFKNRTVSFKSKLLIGFILIVIIGISVWFHIFSPLRLLFLSLLFAAGVALLLKSGLLTKISNK